MADACLSLRFPLLVIAAAVLAGPAAANTLTGWARMDAATFSDGPTSGQFAFTNASSPANNPPYLNKQPVQGFSGVLRGANGSFQMLVDNGFGARGNSPDALLRMVAVQVDWAARSVSAAHFQTGAVLPGYTAASRITLNDAHRKMPFAIVADGSNYPGLSAQPAPGGAAIAVDAAIQAGRLLTGADLDLESVQRDRQGNLWFGEEFGPFLVKTDASGTVQKVIQTPNVLRLGSNPFVQSPSSPVNSGAVNLPGSGGFEGMALNASGTKLHTLLERPLTTDTDQKRLLVQEFDLATETFNGNWFGYKLDPLGTNIGDMTAIDDSRFLVIERNGGTATSALQPFKKIYLIDSSQKDADGFARKTELVDLMNIADPDDLNNDGSTIFTFPYVTIENLLILDNQTLLVVNDNNFPGGGGRAFTSDNTEFLKISLTAPIPEPGTWALMAAGLAALGWRARLVKRRA
ncbi:MAG: esterase-like activity of phytase family protein [Aquabacterium sp.]|nr:esterase-like activity of phytase family protein [Aquabacterium sp.]